MRAVLVSPPTQFAPGFLLPSLALGILSARLTGAGVDHACLDFNLPDEPSPITFGRLSPAEEDAYLNFCLSLVAQHKPEFVGISSWGVAVPFALVFARALKRILPDVAIVCGGLRDIDLAQIVMQTEPAISAVVLGDGEDVLVPLMRRLQPGASGAWPPGVLHREGSEVVLSRRQEYCPPSQWPTPMYGAFQFRPRGEFLFEGSRGCPHNCIFCCLNLEPFRRLSPSVLVDRLEAFCSTHEVDTISFSDNLIPLNGAWTNELCTELERRLKGLRWVCSARADNISLATVARMQRAGCSDIFLGLESVSPETLSYVNKTHSPDRYTRHLIENLRAIAELGVSLRVSTIVGFPRESFDDMRKTLEVVIRLLQLGISGYSGLPMVYPGSTMWHMFRRGQIDLVPVEDERLFRNHSGLFASRFEHSPWFVPNRFTPRHAYLPQGEVEQFLRNYMDAVDSLRRRRPAAGQRRERLQTAASRKA